MCLFIPLRIGLRAMLALAAFAGLVTTAPMFLDGPEGGTLRVYSKNLWYRNPELPALAADIRASGADVVLLQEVSDRNRRILPDLADTFPHQHLCRPSGWSGIAVLSREPLEEALCSFRRGLAAGRIIHDGRPSGSPPSIAMAHTRCNRR